MHDWDLKYALSGIAVQQQMLCFKWSNFFVSLMLKPQLAVTLVESVSFIYDSTQNFKAWDWDSRLKSQYLGVTRIRGGGGYLTLAWTGVCRPDPNPCLE